MLLAEDGRDNQMLISRVLSRTGAEVVLAENGDVAVAMLAETRTGATPFDLVLMDMQMPVRTATARHGGSAKRAGACRSLR